MGEKLNTLPLASAAPAAVPSQTPTARSKEVDGRLPRPECHRICTTASPPPEKRMTKRPAPRPAVLRAPPAPARPPAPKP